MRGPVAKNRVQSQTRLSPSRRAELLADYEEGVPIRVIAAKFGVHRATVSELVRRAGIPARQPGLLTKDHGQAAALYEAGLTLGQVAERFSVSVETVRAAVVAEGVQVRPRGRVSRRLGQA
jgi:DNA-directed RNA polymerase specialized sigma24 family protein